MQSSVYNATIPFSIPANFMPKQQEHQLFWWIQTQQQNDDNDSDNDDYIHIDIQPTLNDL
eukprot:UN08053